MKIARTALLLVLAAAGVACSGGKKAASAPDAVPVTAATARRQDMPIEVSAIGHVEPYSTVSVRAQVGGTVTKVFFHEGQDVREGAPLFEIDERPYESALQQAEGQLARDRAQAASAAADERRYAELVKKDYVTQSQYEQIKANAEALAATVKADQAAVANAKLNLSYCTITAPISGRTGSVLVYAGNVVKANDVPLVVINQIRPILVSFSVPERQLPEIKRRRAAHTLAVEAEAADGSGHPHTGELSFIDNAVDQNTGTILLKGTFPNGDSELWPGEFVNVALTLGVEKSAVVVPASAVQTGQEGQYVFVIKDDSTADLRPVTVERTQGDLAVVAKGLLAGERVVTDGQIRLAPGFKVAVKAPEASQS